MTDLLALGFCFVGILGCYRLLILVRCFHVIDWTTRYCKFCGKSRQRILIDGESRYVRYD